MSNQIYIYLSGSIQKGKTDNRDSFWSEDDISALKSELYPLEIVFLNPATRSDDLSDFLSTFGRDLFQVYCSDVVLVDARDRRGIGIGAEMAFAKFERIPVVSIAPENSHYNRTDFVFMNQPLKTWIHPFVFGLSDAIAPNLPEAATWIRDNCGHRVNRKKEIMGPERLILAMKHYISTQLENDKVMNDLIENNKVLKGRKELLNY